MISACSPWINFTTAEMTATLLLNPRRLFQWWPQRNQPLWWFWGWSVAMVRWCHCTSFSLEPRSMQRPTRRFWRQQCCLGWKTNTLKVILCGSKIQHLLILLELWSTFWDGRCQHFGIQHCGHHHHQISTPATTTCGVPWRGLLVPNLTALYHLSVAPLLQQWGIWIPQRSELHVLSFDLAWKLF